MTAKLLTARAVETMRPRRDAAGEAIRAEYPDAACPGLYLVVQPSGARSWALRYRRPNGKTAKLTLGKDLTLAAARHAASAARLQLERGADPAPKRLSATAYAPEGGEAIEAVFGSFLELHARRKTRPSTAWATERVFNRIVLPAWRGRSIHDITRRDVIDLVEQVATDRPYLANRTLGTLSKFYNWLIARDVVKMSPVTGVERPHKEQVRTRSLADSELRALWKACEGDGPFGDALKVLVLTGARRNEVSQMRWSEIDEKRRLWALPASRSKNHHEHTVPLSSQAWTLIQAQSRFLDCDFVFTADGRRPVTGWDKAKNRLSAKAGIAPASWRLHDLRRTCASGLQRLGIAVPVIEKALNHLSGTFRGIVGTYQQHDYADEIRIALQRWGDHVEQMVSSKPARRRL
jgi:integrase